MIVRPIARSLGDITTSEWHAVADQVVEDKHLVWDCTCRGMIALSLPWPATSAADHDTAGAPIVSSVDSRSYRPERG